MADEPISALTQIAVPPFSSAFTNPSTGAMLEILDTTNTTMASSGTNSKVAPGDLIKGYLAAGSNVTLTETSGIVTIAASGGGMTVGGAVSGGSNHATLVEDGSGNLAALAIGSAGQVITVVAGAPAWANAVTENAQFAGLSSDYNSVPYATPANIGLSITLPVAGTYIIIATVRAGISGNQSTTAGGQVWITGQIYDTTNATVIPYSPAIVAFGAIQTIGLTVSFQAVSPMGPFLYTPTVVPATINIQAA